jgi:Heterokaryon incompatibility protein (HET)
MPKPFDIPFAPLLSMSSASEIIDKRDDSLSVFEPDGLRALLNEVEDRDSLPNRGSFEGGEFCSACEGLIAFLRGWMKRDEKGWDHDGFKMIVSVHAVLRSSEGRRKVAFSPLDVVASAALGCPLCSLAIGSSLNTGRMPFNFLDWCVNRDWSSRLDLALWDMYGRTRSPETAKSVGVRLCGLAFGESLSATFDAPNEGAWANIVMMIDKDVQRLRQTSLTRFTTSLIGECPKPPLCESTGDPEALDLAVWWLKRCQEEHGDCWLHYVWSLFQKCKTDEPKSEDVRGDWVQPGPTRLLFVGSRDEPSLRLEICKFKNAVDEKYFCLSYCWGKKEFPRLTVDNLTEFTNGLNYHELPATIRDAIQVTRWMGYKYLWIDSLCIVQDSEEDWKNESAKMGSIYRNSDLTIAALGAANSFEGCFMRRNPLLFRDCKVPGTNFVLTNAVDGYDREHHAIGPAASPLQTRAWVVQEQLLPPRTLFFGSAGLYWQCLECEADEWEPLGAQVSFNGWSREKQNLKKLLAKVLEPLQDTEVKFIPLWEKILEKYTACKLTRVTDKLVAISGVAKELESALRIKYCAGLWVEHLLPGLLWHSRFGTWDHQNQLGRLDIGAPTFSWAAVLQPIVFGLHFSDPHVEFEDGINVTIEEDHSYQPEQARTSEPKHVLRAKTQLKEVALLPKNLKRANCPRAILLASGQESQFISRWSSETAESCCEPVEFDYFRYTERHKGSEEDCDRIEKARGYDGPFTYSWVPDIPLEQWPPKAWYMCLAKYEYTGSGTVGLILTPRDATLTRWTRIGYLNYCPSPPKEGILTVVKNQRGEVAVEETAKVSKTNPFLVDPEGAFVHIEVE